ALAAAAATPSTRSLAGVPYLVKDLIAEIAGVPFSEGSRFLRANVSHDDSELITRLRRAGLVIVGKTNTPEFGMVPTCEPRLHGQDTRGDPGPPGLRGRARRCGRALRIAGPRTGRSRPARADPRRRGSDRVSLLRRHGVDHQVLDPPPRPSADQRRTRAADPRILGNGPAGDGR